MVTSVNFKIHKINFKFWKIVQKLTARWLRKYGCFDWERPLSDALKENLIFVQKV